MIIINSNGEILLVIDYDVLERYSKYYFMIHKRAKKVPIKYPYQESINEWMIMQRPAMNSLKQKWKDFIKWFVEDQGYANLRITQCEISQAIFYKTNRPHDIDNSVPKFILDGLVKSEMIVDDSSEHVTKLTLECGVDTRYPRTELRIKVLELSYADNEDCAVSTEDMCALFDEGAEE